MKRSILAAALLLPFLWAAPAQAAVPVTFSGGFIDDGSIDCSEFNPSWTFSDNYVDYVNFRGTVFFDSAGNPIRILIHYAETSDDVNSATGFTLHEHNHYVIILDLVAGTATYNGAITTLQRPHFGSVVAFIGHKVFPLGVHKFLANAGPDRAEDIDFCRALLPV